MKRPVWCGACRAAPWRQATSIRSSPSHRLRPRSRPSRAVPEGLDLNLSRTEFEQLRELVHRLCGLALSEEKAYLLRHRLGPVARAAGCASFAEFLGKLAGTEGAALREPI